MKLQPLSDRGVVKPQEAEEKTRATNEEASKIQKELQKLRAQLDETEDDPVTQIKNELAKLRKELNSAVKKENYLNEEDEKLIKQFLDKVKKELE